MDEEREVDVIAEDVEKDVSEDTEMLGEIERLNAEIERLTVEMSRHIETHERLTNEVNQERSRAEKAEKERDEMHYLFMNKGVEEVDKNKTYSDMLKEIK